MPAGCSASWAPGTGRTPWPPASGPAWSASRLPLLLVLGERVVHAVRVTPGIFPGHVVVGVGVVGRLVHPRPARVEQVAQVAAQQVPVEVVRLVAVLALDDQPTH